MMVVDEEDSLFGSPPPSPQPGPRQVYPDLALPSGQMVTSTVNKNKNVGTIALPGSQLDSELPINPLALSLSHGSMVHRPPASFQGPTNPKKPPTTSIGGISGAVYGASSPASPDSTPPPAAAPVKKTARRRKRPSSASNTPDLSLPIEYPDPSAPPPVRFLRNQDNLLGKAGRVGGVKAAALVHSQNSRRGSTHSNPILVEDEVRTQSKSTSGSSSKADFPQNVAPPSNEEIVSVLVGQKDIFPILEGILKIIAKTTQANSNPKKRKPNPKSKITSKESLKRRATSPPDSATVSAASSSFPYAHLLPSSCQQDPELSVSSFPSSLSNPSRSVTPQGSETTKKRKLYHVPAGASDWDVPFPFSPGEGPENYQRTWEKERGKILVQELVKLVRTAAKKAVVKRDGPGALSGRESDGTKAKSKDDVWKAEKRVNGYYRPETALYGLELEEMTTKGKSSSNPQPKAQVQPSTTKAHSHLAESLSPSPSSPSSSTFDFTDVYLPTSSTSTSVDSTSGHSTPIMGVDGLDVDQGQNQHMFDTWMNFLEAFPVSLDGFGFGNVSTTTNSPLAHENSSLAVAETANDDLQTITGDFTGQLPAMGGSVALGSLQTNSPMPGMNDINFFTGTMDFSSFGQGSTSTLDFGSFDFSAPNVGQTSSNPMTEPIIDPFLLALDGIDPSASSSGFVADESHGTLASNTSNTNTSQLSLEFQVTDKNSTPGKDGEVMDVDVLQIKEPESTAKGKGKEKEKNPPTLLTPPTPVTVQEISDMQFGSSSSSQSRGPVSLSAAPSDALPAARDTRMARKADIISRAQERKKQLQKELEDVKMRLWETTVEEAVLIGMGRIVDERDMRQELQQGESS